MYKDHIFYLKTRVEIESNIHLIDSLNMNIFEFYNEILKYKLEILKIIKEKYPKNHMFSNEQFKFSNYLFCFSYSKLICEKYLHNKNIMDDYINKKFISKYNGKFCNKTYNENLSEFTVFYYILTSIFVESDLYKNIEKLEYEGEGANNKRYEYSFILKDGKRLNFEVKTITCDPFITSNLKLHLLQDGDLLYKTYFPKTNIEDYVNIDDKYKGNKLESDYRKTKKNIKSISQKFKKDSPKDINIGVLCINYGTSIEEFISYMYNQEYGIMNKDIDIDNIDNLILFSMSSEASSITLDDLYTNYHVLSICNKENEIFKKLRIDKYISKEGKLSDKFKNSSDEYYGIYKYIHRKGFVHIVPNYIKEEMIRKFFGTVSTGKNNIDNFVNLSNMDY